ncbi:MAG: class I SAM-dependent methyltransferase [Fibrobacterota bacterium]|nr:class I SAM-dependent methyltransferase [Fibrobacterota bacterium]QQS06022.1 MAG: class I SAM-dependent methyltransferase [Fibrobacterota bacterium]
MDILETARMITFHRRRLGQAPLKQLGWRDAHSQIVRFDALCRWGDLSGKVVLDLGCGHGDLKPHLDARFSDLKYLGLDIMPEFVEEARRRYGHLPDTHFLQANFLTTGLPDVDVVLACGSLNYWTENVLHPEPTILKMWEIAKLGVAFNLLDENEFASDQVLCGHDPDQILSFCRNLDPTAELDHGYSPEDFTILMRR